MTMKLCTKRPGKHKNLGAADQYCKPCSALSSIPSTEPEPEPTMEDLFDTSETLQPSSMNTSPTLNGILADNDEIDEYIDSIHLPDALPDQYFHIDFGFVRGSNFKMKINIGDVPTIMSIDGKKSYCLIVDRVCYMWVYLRNTKTPPVEPVCMVLRKFGAKCTHRTVRMD